MELKQKLGTWLLRLVAFACFAGVCVALYLLLTRFDVLDKGVALVVALLAFLGLVLMHRQSEIGYELKQFQRLSDPAAPLAPELEARLASLERKLLGLSQSSQKALTEQKETLLNALAGFEKKLAYQVQEDDHGIVSGDGEAIGKKSPGLPSASLKPFTDIAGEIPDREPSEKTAAAVLAGDRNISLHLQPIVNLPDRTPVFFEAFMRLKTASGGYLEQRKFFKLAEEGGLLPVIDRKVLHSSARLLQKLSSLKKPAKVFCRLSGRTLDDEAVREELLTFLQSQQQLCQNLVIDFDQRTYLAMQGGVTQYLTKLKRLGISFCLSEVLDLKLDAKQLERRGFKFIRVAGSILLRARQEGKDVIAAEQLAEVMENHGIDVISNEIEREKDVLGLIDLDVIFAQGTLFAPPRPVKADLVENKAA